MAQTHWPVAASRVNWLAASQVVQAEGEAQTRQPAWHSLQGPGARVWK